MPSLSFHLRGVYRWNLAFLERTCDALFILFRCFPIAKVCPSTRLHVWPLWPDRVAHPNSFCPISIFGCGSPLEVKVNMVSNTNEKEAAFTSSSNGSGRLSEWCDDCYLFNAPSAMQMRLALPPQSIRTRFTGMYHLVDFLQ